MRPDGRMWLAGMILALGCAGGTAGRDPGPGGNPDADVPGTVEDSATGTDGLPEGVPDGPGDAASPTDAPEDRAAPADLPDARPDDPGPGPDPGNPDLPPPNDAPGDGFATDLDAADGPEDVSYAIRDCKELQACFQQCCDNQSPCPDHCGDLCWNQASPEAQADMNAYLGCIRDQCPACEQEPRPRECDECEQGAQADACRTETLRCWDFGEWTCAQVVACIDDCQDLEACIACVGRASLEARIWLDPLGQCLVAECPSGIPDSPVLPLDACERNALAGACATPYSDCLDH